MNIAAAGGHCDDNQNISQSQFDGIRSGAAGEPDGRHLDELRRWETAHSTPQVAA